jgi:selenocysteine-specific elongation factor
VEEVRRGQRAAINMAGIRLEDVVRGQELATPGYLLPSQVLTVRLLCLPGRKRAIKHRLPVRLHLATAEVMATVSLLDGDAIEPGQWGFAQLFAEEPVSAVWGQPFVVRESSALRTIGGGQVLQPTARKIRRRHPEVLQRLQILVSAEAQQKALAVAWFAGFEGFSPGDLVRGAGVTPAEAQAVIRSLQSSGDLVEQPAASGRQFFLHREQVVALEERLVATLARMHDQFPLMATHDRQKVQAQLDYIGSDPIVHATVERLLAKRRLVGDHRRIGLADFRPKLSANLRKLKDRLIATYRESRFQPPEPASFASQAGGNASNLSDLLDVCVAEGHLAKVSNDLFLHSEVEAEMRRLIGERLAAGHGLTVAEIRDLLGTTRKYAIPLCEYLDRIGLTRREGDLRLSASAKPTS